MSSRVGRSAQQEGVDGCLPLGTRPAAAGGYASARSGRTAGTIRRWGLCVTLAVALVGSAVNGAGLEANRVVHADQGATLILTVVDQNGNPIDTTRLSTAIVILSFVSHNVGRVIGPGTLEISLPSGPTSPLGVCVTYDAFGPGTPRGQCIGNFDLAPGAQVARTLQIDLAAPLAGPSRGWITGAVTLQGSGIPVASASVAIAATPLQTVTGADGRYQFPGISTTDGQNGGPSYVVTITPPSGEIAAGPATQTVTVPAGQGAEADFVVKPAFTPFWVESFVPVTTEWSGSGAGAAAFGNRGQWSRFLVVAPQQGSRLYVHDPTTQDDAWIDAGDVGPSGPPPGRP